MVDLFAGLGGWAEGGLAEGYDVIGFDIERHVYSEHCYPAQLVVQDVLTLHGSQFRDADLIVASPPCQEYSYMAMPWSIAKAKAAAIRADTTGAEHERLNRLFNACFRIQREACEAAGRHIPMIVENVRGAIPWVGRSRWNYGSFHLWGDVPALMPLTFKATKVPGFRFDGSGASFQTAAVAVKVRNPSWRHPSDPRHVKGLGFNTIADRNLRENGRDPMWKKGFTATAADGIKCGGDWFNSDQPSISRTISSKSPARKHASAMIAKIPLPLSQYIATVFKPR